MMSLKLIVSLVVLVAFLDARVFSAPARADQQSESGVVPRQIRTESEPATEDPRPVSFLNRGDYILSEDEFQSILERLQTEEEENVFHSDFASDDARFQMILELLAREAAVSDTNLISTPATDQETDAATIAGIINQSRAVDELQLRGQPSVDLQNSPSTVGPRPHTNSQGYIEDGEEFARFIERLGGNSRGHISTTRSNPIRRPRLSEGLILDEEEFRRVIEGLERKFSRQSTASTSLISDDANSVDNNQRLPRGSDDQLAEVTTSDRFDSGDYISDEEEFARTLEQMKRDFRRSISSNPLNFVSSDVSHEEIIRRIEQLESDEQSNVQRIANLQQEGENGCAICLEPYKENLEDSRLLPCCHRFHRHCLASWCESQRQHVLPATCPICRINLNP